MNNSNVEHLLSKLKIFMETVWDNKISMDRITLWLNNFEEHEREDLLFLLTQFIFLSKFQISNMLISIFRDFIKYSIIEDFRIKNSHTLDSTLIKEHLRSTMLKTRFLPIGNPAGSSATLLYEFRGINRLQDNLFIERASIDTLTDDIEHFIFIDDICGSGSQVKSFNTDIVNNIKTKYPLAKIHYYTLVGSDKGLNFISSLGWFTHIDSVVKLDESYKCFSDESRFFKNNSTDIEELKKTCSKYGLKLYESIMLREGYPVAQAKDHQLGYKDSQLILGFDHNTPDNTLPIFWYNEDMIDWTPIFPRKNKVY